MYVKFTTCSWLNHVKSTMESHHFLQAGYLRFGPEELLGIPGNGPRVVREIMVCLETINHR